MNPQEQQSQNGLDMGNFKLPNGLTIAQDARLKKLLEELNEAGKAAAKILNYGFVATYKGVTYDNRADLQNELGDIRAVTRALTRKGDLFEEAICQHMVVKFPEVLEMIPFEHADDHLLDVRQQP
jgi:hypothetical protein